MYITTCHSSLHLSAGRINPAGAFFFSAENRRRLQIKLLTAYKAFCRVGSSNKATPMNAATSLRYSIRKMATDWAIFDHRLNRYTGRGYSYEEAQDILSEEGGVEAEYDDPRDSQADRAYQMSREQIR